MRGFEIIVRRQWEEVLTLEELARASGTHPELIEYYVEFGLIEPVEVLGRCLFFGLEMVAKLGMIERLRSDMGVNLPGVAIILDLTDKVRRLQNELEWLKEKIGDR